MTDRYLRQKRERLGLRTLEDPAFEVICVLQLTILPLVWLEFLRTLKQVFNGMEKAKDHKGHISKKSTVRQREKPFVLVLMLKMLFQKAGEKSLIDRRNAHHVTFKQNITGATLTKMLY